MNTVDNLISRMEAISNVTINQKKRLLNEISDMAPRIQQLIKLINAAEKNGLSVRYYREHGEGLPAGNLGVDNSYLIFKTTGYDNWTDDKYWYIDCNGDVYRSNYGGINGVFDDTFKVKPGRPEYEDLNKKDVSRLRDIKQAFFTLEAKALRDIDDQITIKEAT